MSADRSPTITLRGGLFDGVTVDAPSASSIVYTELTLAGEFLKHRYDVGTGDYMGIDPPLPPYVPIPPTWWETMCWRISEAWTILTGADDY